jgi:transcriptional regulator with XRE-family HTH domain
MYCGEDLKFLRLVKKLNQRAVAKKLRITQQAYSKIEQKETLETGRFNYIMQLMNCSKEELELLKQLPGKK